MNQKDCLNDFFFSMTVHIIETKPFHSLKLGEITNEI